ncbi:hypothetical protein SERLA73DRAFT_177433 [Serpula lacrymans var. lacrymans S7.3]|uniref:Exonuclease domain-containing protein n=2 Tax=Serpula lacrymans var. lacrymans TaxID=341189 RepID=F8PNZ5_SERL3|nr:uncharacterized protein SERLADRAFT_461027 [Serpula lacrymans var. lacrymans S7.9]EGO01872.1 hypothetical protein SERLA73DRAFT_177433 [Serpula lacrymans var. lacrymans S7.3]EGO27500.1 hypothetical protein SERLADRAFT_461027 [Serpula lacrymans var. lacrymans S7.9]
MSPTRHDCMRPPSILSSTTDLHSPPIPTDSIDDSKQPSSSTTATSVSGPSKLPMASTSGRTSAAPAKRPFELSAPSALDASTSEPPRQRQKLSATQKPIPKPSIPPTAQSGVPILRINAALSQVALPVRQAMVKSLYDHFVVLYDTILPTNPTIATEHALRQEEEVYKKSNKLAYRNAVISSIVTLKKRPFPDSISHPSVGTEGDLAIREESRKKRNSLRLTRAHLDSLVMSIEDMQKWGYITGVPDGIGGDRPHAEGKVMQCERCAQPYMVKRDAGVDECIFHWGRPFTKAINGERLRLYSCCSKSTSDGQGCSRGSHVFYESNPEDIHARHPFSFTSNPAPEGKSAASSSGDTALDVVALDCEMIYTTGGMRVARVSVVDGSGAEIFDELVRMDEGVEIIDYNTRFSGITQEDHSKATLSLSSIRNSLDAFINSDTIIVGHALDNDLKTLRMIHHRCIDTVVLFPHRLGAPYRRALRDLAKEHLGLTIQTGGGSVGHSSVEDSIATLDLVRHYVLNDIKPKPKPTPSSTSALSAKEGTDVVATSQSTPAL